MTVEQEGSRWSFRIVVYDLITYEADSVTGHIQSLTSVNLAIGTHQYSLSDVGVISGTVPLIGGTLHGIGSIWASTYDFWLQFDIEQPMPMSFYYSDASYNTIYESRSFSSFSIAPVSASEPSIMLLLGLGLIGLAGVRQKLRK